MLMYVFSFEKLEVWQEAKEFSKMIYEITSNFPDTEKFGLTSQLRRASISIASNIAEGSGRTSNKEFIHFLNISISSSFELETQLILANDLFNTDSEEIIEKINELQKMIVGFKKSLDVKYDSSLTSNF